jgi:uncharacterized membrane protein
VTLYAAAIIIAMAAVFTYSIHREAPRDPDRPTSAIVGECLAMFALTAAVITATLAVCMAIISLLSP